MRRHNPWMWGVMLGVGVVLGALGAAFVVLGLERADQLAGVIGMFVAAAGLAVSVYGLRSARRSPGGPADQDADPVPRTPPPVPTLTQTVADSTVGGDVLQVGEIKGSLRIGGTPPPPPAQDTATTTAGRSAPPDPGGQTVENSRIGGSVHQVGDVGGDVEIDR
ncbi:hypothetical protein [Rhizohabitans arisaemae]|uniref:hypothetical protein n=1 Tax=Rhizohabitans arisaemae TaxID=2720610 RepID=UPI0024B194F8|nr:hypothetical protein [Rhizohabitans arisaemae]